MRECGVAERGERACVELSAELKCGQIFGERKAPKNRCNQILECLEYALDLAGRVLRLRKTPLLFALKQRSLSSVG